MPAHRPRHDTRQVSYPSKNPQSIFISYLYLKGTSSSLHHSINRQEQFFSNNFFSQISKMSSSILDLSLAKDKGKHFTVHIRCRKVVEWWKDIKTLFIQMILQMLIQRVSLRKIHMIFNIKERKRIPPTCFYFSVPSRPSYPRDGSGHPGVKIFERFDICIHFKLIWISVFIFNSSMDTKQPYSLHMISVFKNVKYSTIFAFANNKIPYKNIQNLYL